MRKIVLKAGVTKEDTKKILVEYSHSISGCVMHCYSYDLESALEFKELGCVFGVGGVVTFKNGKVLQEAVKGLELADIVLETDCPYLAPEPYRGKRNSSVYLPHVAEAVAGIKGISTDEVAAKTNENAKKLFPRLSI